MNIECGNGGSFASIELASYGTPVHTDAIDCAEWAIDTPCHAPNSTAIVAAACLHRQRCSFAVSNDVFGEPCGGVSKTLAIRATCSGVIAIYGSHTPLSASQDRCFGMVRRWLVGQAEGVLAVRDLVDAVAFDVQKHLAAFLAKPL